MTLIRHANSFALTLSLLSSSLFSSADAAGIVISEVAYSGTSDDVCNGEDWVELANTNGSDVDLTGYVLHDDKGPTDEDAATIGGVTIPSQGYILMCRENDFAFGIGSSDTVTLLDPSGQIVDSVSMAGDGPDEATYARIDGEFKYTNNATPGADNVLEEPVPLEDLLAEAYAAADGLFGPDDYGDVIDIDVSVDEEALAIIRDHPAWEEYVDFIDLKVSTSSGAGEAFSSAGTVTSAGNGRIRVRGQSTNTITACMGLRNVPFGIEFETPFLGIEQMYLRNHLLDPSYMRDAMAHYMLKSVGLPYSRTKPARLFMNGEYIGFYTLMEAPTQGHVLQNSFGAFDPQKTSIFKFKTAFNTCPYDAIDTMMADPSDTDLSPETYYFERGRHRTDTPILGSGMEGIGACSLFFIEEIGKEYADVAQYYLEHGEDCTETMIELGRVDRDYGPKSMEDSMKNFLDKYFDKDVDDLNDFIDTDQWLQNFAFMALVIHPDSPMMNINNWYLATTNGGEDWKIVQYDHNGIAKSDMAELLCAPQCGGPDFVYWSILQPTCGPIEDHRLVGRVLNSVENMEKYLSYVREYVDILSSDEVLDTIKAYGETIKEYVAIDPLNFYYETVEAYESFELGEDTSDYYSPYGDSFYKVVSFRFEEILKQLEAIDAGTMPGDGVYDPQAKCPDWRDPNGGLKEKVGSGVPVESNDCGSEMLELGCADAALCFNHDFGICLEDGTFSVADCEQAVPCAPCFPNSRCGSGESSPATEDIDETGVPVESDACGPEILALGCADATPCFSHSGGICLEDGTFSIADCEQAAPCAPCYPNSRCGSLVEGEDGEEEEEEVAIGEEEDESSLPEVEGEDAPDSGAEPEPKEEEKSESAVSGATGRGIIVAGWLALLSGLLLSSMVIA